MAEVGAGANERRPPIDIVALAVPSSVSLIVGWRRGGTVHGGEIKIAAPVHLHLQNACSATVDNIRQCQLRPYTADTHLEPGDDALFADRSGIADSPLLAVLFPTSPHKTINARSLPKYPLLFYAATGTNGGTRIAFLRKANPRRAARPGRMFALLGDTLTESREPVFTLDPSFDMIATPNGVVTTSQSTFELLFKDTEAVVAAVPEWIQNIASHLPLAGDGAARLAEKAASSSRLRRKLQAIQERGHLAQVTVENVRAHLDDLGLDAADFIRDDALVVDAADPSTLLHLLNEDLFKGGLTQAPFQSDRKSQRPPSRG
jgi:hypothetical protein